jgi:acetylornithine deacetylase/succinyl-diaminopimelate desuccinylase-like protein
VLSVEDERIYGRGTADNKGQWTVNMGAFEAAYRAREGQLGFNARLIVETAEERGSPGLKEFCRKHAGELAADLFIASDGPRLNASTPTVFLGSRGILNFELSLQLREGAHHSGNWGGVLRNPGTVLASAIASLVDMNGVIRTPLLRPGTIPPSVTRSVQGMKLGGESGDPSIDDDWGEPGLSPAERLFAWNTLEVLAIECGNVKRPIGAIPAGASAVLQLRYVVGTDLHNIQERLQRHFDMAGMPWVRVRVLMDMAASRVDPDHPVVTWAISSIRATTGKEPAILPNLGGTIPNDVFADELGLPTVWVPHSYPACSQHAPNEHLLASAARQGLEIMAGLFWDLGERSVPVGAGRGPID